MCAASSFHTRSHNLTPSSWLVATSPMRGLHENAPSSMPHLLPSLTSDGHCRARQFVAPSELQTPRPWPCWASSLSSLLKISDLPVMLPSTRVLSLPVKG